MDIETIQVKLRLAEPEDLKVDARTLRYGQSFWLRSIQTKAFDNKAYIINQDTDPLELATWLKNKMIYVPVSDLDLVDGVPGISS